MRSVWRDHQVESKAPSFPSLEGDIKTDILIIGGGIAGILTAHLLKERGAEYILVEKDRICGGCTDGTTAKITVQHGLIYSKLMEHVSLDAAEVYLQANLRSFNRLSGLCKDIDCDYEVRDSYVYSRDDLSALRKEVDSLEKLGYTAELCSTPELPITTLGAVRFKDQAQFNPLKFLFSLAKGLNIRENTPVREIKGMTAITDHGAISAERIVLATHFPMINKQGLYFLKMFQHRSYVIALKGAASINGMYISDKKDGLSFRGYKDLLLIGGGGHRTGKQGGGFEELRELAAIAYPSSVEKYAWATQDCISLDGLAYIGQHSKTAKKIYTATGFNKWGMTGSMLAAEILADALTGRRNDFSDAFSPGRSILKPRLFTNTFEALKGLISPGAPRCSHLGCALRWNNAERTWDCSCHGSRFSEAGDVIDGPAGKDLPKD